MIIVQSYLEEFLEDQRMAMQDDGHNDVGAWIGKSAAARALIEESERLASSHFNIHITGPIGVGKKVMATRIHNLSGRLKFVSFRCGLWGKDNSEKLLFGYVKKDQKGTSKFYPGALQMAHGGSLYLEGLESLHPVLQDKLAQALNEGKVYPVGSSKAVACDIRVLSSASISLEAMINRDKLTSNLADEIGGTTLNIPPLTNRKEDIPLLIEYFKNKLWEQSTRRINLESNAIEALCNYPWPGNGRQLFKVMEKISLTSEENISLEDLPEELITGSPIHSETEDTSNGTSAHLVPNDATWKEYRRITDRVFIARILKQHSGNITRAAQQLNVNRETVHRWINELGLKKENAS